MCCLRLNLFWEFASGYRLCFFLADNAIFVALIYISTLEAVCVPLSFLVWMVQQTFMVKKNIYRKSVWYCICTLLADPVFSSDFFHVLDVSEGCLGFFRSMLCPLSLQIMEQIVDVSVLCTLIQCSCSVPPLTDDNLFLIFQSFPTHCASQYKHVPSVGQRCITFSLPAFFLPLDRSHCVQLQLQCTLSSHPNLSALSSPLYFFSLFLSSSRVVKTLTFFTLFFLFFSLSP